MLKPIWMKNALWSVGMLLVGFVGAGLFWLCLTAYQDHVKVQAHEVVLQQIVNLLNKGQASAPQAPPPQSPLPPAR